MPAESPRRRGRTPLLLGLLALLAAFIAPPASADHDRGVWYRWAHDAATGTYNEGVAINGAGRISYTYKEVGHQHGNRSNTCMKMSYKVKSPSGGFDLTVDGRNVTGAHVTLTNTAIWLSGAQGGWGNVKVRNPNPTAGTVTVSIEVKNEGGQNIGNLPCSAGETNDIFFTITVAAAPVWTTLRFDRNAANGNVSPVRVSRSTSGGQIGQRFHRFYTGCNRISVGLRSGASDALELSVYSSGTPSTGSLSDLRMQDGHAGDRNVRLMHKAGATLTAGAVYTVTVEATGHSSCTGTAPADYSAEWKFTVVTPVTWSDDTYHDETATLLAAVSLNAGASITYTGLAFDKRSSCTANGASLDPDSHDIFALYRYNGTTRNTTLNVTAFSFSNDRHVRIYMRSSYTTHVDSTLTASVLIDPTCTRLDVPYPLTLTWPVTVYAPAAWVTLSADNLTALSVFSASEIQESSQAIDTGVKIQRNSSACASTDVILGSQTSLFELYQHNAAGNRTGSGAARHDGVAMPASGGGHVGLHFKAGATITAPTTLQVVLRAEANSSCTDVRTPTAASASTVAIALRPGRAAWERRGSDQLAPAAAFSSYDLLDSDSPTPTGVQIHRSSSACSSTDVTLGADTPSYLGLDLHGDGSDAVDLQNSHSGVEMPGSGAADRHLRLYFAANANVPDGTLTVTLTLSASCAASSELPRPLQVVYQLRVRTPADHAWVALRSDSQDLRTTLFKQSEVFEDDNLATGIHLHRNSAECAATDVALLGNTDLFELVRYSAAGAADGAGSASQTAVPMTGRGDAADRHVRLRFRQGAFPPGPALTASLRLSPASSCTSRRNPDPVTFAYTLAVDEDVDPPPTISVTPSTPVTIAADAATTGIRITGTDDDDPAVTFTLASGSQALWQLISVGVSAYELRPRAGAALRPGGRYTVEFIAADDNGDTGESRGRATVAIIDGAPVISLSAAAVELRLNQGEAIASGLRISTRDDDASNVLVSIDGAARATFELRGAAGGHELWVRAGVTLVSEELFTVTITATDAEGPGAAQSSSATALLSVGIGSGAATDAAAVDAGAAAVRAIGVAGIDAVLNRPAAGSGPGAGVALLELLAAKEHELESGDTDLYELLEGQAAALPLSQSPGGGAGLGLWLAGSNSDVAGVTGEGEDAVYVEGSVSSAHFGFDARVGPLLAGLGYGLHKTTAEYGYDENRSFAPSEYELDLQALQPYLAFDVGGARLALAAALGEGALYLRPAGAAARERLDADYMGYALGLMQRLQVLDNGELRLRGSYAASDLDVADSAADEQPSLDSEGSVLRLGMGYEHALRFGEDSSVNPFLEAGYLLLGGDGATESSGLVTGGMAYASGSLRASASYQQALGDEVTLEGYELTFRFSPQLGGLGLGLEADPGYGLAGAEEMLAELDAGRRLGLGAGDARGLRGGAGISYGLAVDGGLLTPYGRWGVEAGRELGLRLRAGTRRSWALGYGAAANELKIEYRLGD